jgi:hypothetical protein
VSYVRGGKHIITIDFDQINDFAQIQAKNIVQIKTRDQIVETIVQILTSKSSLGY